MNEKTNETTGAPKPAVKISKAKITANHFQSPLNNGGKKPQKNTVALCPVKYTDQIDKNFRRLDCGIVPRSSRFCLCKRVWY